MRENITKDKLVAFAKKLACKRHGTDQEFNLYYSGLSPIDTVGRCYPCTDKRDGRHAGHDIVISSIWLHRCYTDINGFKAVLLHELVHTNRHIRGHGMDFRRGARRMNVRTYFKMSEGNF